MTTKIYRGMVSLLLLFAIGKVVSFTGVDDMVQATEKKEIETVQVNDSVPEGLSSSGYQIEEIAIGDISEVKEENTKEIAISDERNEEIKRETNELLEGQENEQVVVEEVKEQQIKQDSSVQVKQNIPMTMYINNQAISYENGGESYGQAIIDADNNKVSTWGGASVQNGDDGLSTHFIGHNPGIFSVLFSLSIGSDVRITDSSGNSSTYIVSQVWVVDNYGFDANTGRDTWDLITSPYNGEAVSLQTCIDDDFNLIVFAIK